MFIKTSFLITIISDLLTLMIIPIRTFECKLWEPILYANTHYSNLIRYAVIDLVQRLVRFVLRTEPKASYRTVQYEYMYRYTPNIYACMYVCIYGSRQKKENQIGSLLKFENHCFIWSIYS